MTFHYPDDSAEAQPPVPGPLKPYDVVIRGTQTTLLLNEADAKELDLLADEPEPTPEPAPEPEPEPTPAPEPAEKVAPAPPNKARFNLLNKKD